MKSVFSLSHVGKRVYAGADDYGHRRRPKVTMVIQAPRGRMAIFADRTNGYTRQAEAVRAFVEQHRDNQ